MNDMGGFGFCFQLLKNPTLSAIFLPAIKSTYMVWGKKVVNRTVLAQCGTGGLWLPIP